MTEVLLARDAPGATPPSPAPPIVMRQSTISTSPHVQKVLGDIDLTALIFMHLCTWQRVWPAGTCKQWLVHRPRDPTPWLRTALLWPCDQRDQYVSLAKLAEGMERHDEMLAYMRRAVECSVDDLSYEERNLLCLAFKLCIRTRCASLRTLLTIERKNKEAATTCTHPPLRQRADLAEAYCVRLAAEINFLNEDFLRHIDILLARVGGRNTSAAEARVFYLKCRYDYHVHYQHVLAPPASVDKPSNETKEARDALADTAYAAAAIAAQDLRASHPVRLGLCLNRARHLAERDRGAEAATLTTALLNAAAAELPSLDEESYTDTMLVLQMIRDGGGGLPGWAAAA